MENESQQLTKKERRELKQQEKRERLASEARGRTAKQLATWGVVLFVAAASAAGIFWFVSNNADQLSAGLLASDIVESDWKRGNTEAAVVLLEYGDFQCPACASYHPIVKQLEEEYRDRVAFVFRNFPLRNIHPQADVAARAAEAAGVQGKFWEMHDVLFEQQSSWSTSNDIEDVFAGYAQELGLNTDQFRSDLTSDAVKDAVQSDFSGGQLSGVQGTPTFFVNGEAISNPRNVDEFRTVLNSALGE